MCEVLALLVYALQPGTLGDNREDDVDATPQSIDRGPNPEACRYMNESLGSPVVGATVAIFVIGRTLRRLEETGVGGGGCGCGGIVVVVCFKEMARVKVR